MYLKSNFSGLFFLFMLMGKCSILHAQVLVHEEPRHHPVFQNNKIRILDVRMPPGDTSQYHTHHTASLFIFLSNTESGSQLQGAAASVTKYTAGRILFENLAPPHTRIHRVWNIDKDTLHVMDVELLFKDTGFVQAPLKAAHLQLSIDTAWVRAYRLTLLKGEEFAIRNKAHAFILVSLDAAAVQTTSGHKKKQQEMGAGSFVEIKKAQSFALKNTIDSAARFVVLELPR